MQSQSPNDQLAREVEVLREKVAQQQRQLTETRTEFERVCKALEQRGIKVEPVPTKPPPA